MFFGFSKILLNLKARLREDNLLFINYCGLEKGRGLILFIVV